MEYNKTCSCGCKIRYEVDEFYKPRVIKCYRCKAKVDFRSKEDQQENKDEVAQEGENNETF